LRILYFLPIEILLELNAIRRNARRRSAAACCCARAGTNATAAKDNAAPRKRADRMGPLVLWVETILWLVAPEFNRYYVEMT